MPSIPLPYFEAARPTSGVHWRMRRGYRRAGRLGREVAALATVHGALYLGPDEDVQSLFEAVGLGVDAVAVLRFIATGTASTVAAPTLRTWAQPRLRARTSTLADEASSPERAVVVVPPTEVTREPRLGNAQRIVQTMLPPVAGDVATISRCIETAGGDVPLLDCEEALAGPWARERIFGLMAGGHVGIDLEGDLCGRSLVRLRPRDWSFGWNVLGWGPDTPT